jgi:hypothetical protein
MRWSIAETRNIFSVARGLALLMLAAVALAGCETTGLGPAPAAQAAKAPEPPMTHTRAARECWMGTEKGYADMPLDKRADVVDKCIEQKMKAAQTAPKT